MVSARSILFTLFGDVFLNRMDAVPLSLATALLAHLDFRAEATRAALSRMAREGWFTTERHGRQSVYCLTMRGQDRLMDARERIYRQKDEPWDGTFSILGTMMPSLPPNTRRNLIRELEWISWAPLGPYQWVTPLVRQRETVEVLARYHLQTTSWQINGTLTTPDPVQWTAHLYPIETIDKRYQEFIDDWSHFDENLSETQAFVYRIKLVHAWRKFLFIDPGLPQALVPSKFAREEARILFHHLYALWLEPSTTFIEHSLKQAVLLS